MADGIGIAWTADRTVVNTYLDVNVEHVLADDFSTACGLDLVDRDDCLVWKPWYVTDFDGEARVCERCEDRLWRQEREFQAKHGRRARG